MNEQLPFLVIDFAKNRFRTSRKTLAQIGSPSHVHLLVHPKARIIALKACDPLDARAHNVTQSCEIYSLYLVQSLRELGSWVDSATYRMHASACLDKQMLTFKIDEAFPLDTEARSRDKGALPCSIT